MRVEEKEFIDYIKEHYKEPITTVDVGANLGKYTDYINERMETKKSYLFEPIKSCFDSINRKENYELYNIGVGSKKGDFEFYEAEGKESHSSIVNREWLYSKPEYRIHKKLIHVDRLDNIIKEKVEVLKIDTEGYELEVLKGSENLLKEGKIDFIQFEYGGCFKDNSVKMNDVIDFLKKYDYYIYELKDNNFEKIEWYEDDYRWVNFYATKKEL